MARSIIDSGFMARREELFWGIADSVESVWRVGSFLRAVMMLRSGDGMGLWCEIGCFVYKIPGRQRINRSFASVRSRV